jgi:hypothetical protein
MSITQKRAAITAIDNLFSENLLLVKQALDFRKKVENKEIDQDFIEALCLQFEKVELLTIYDYHLMKYIYNQIQSGDLYYKVIDIGSSPERDSNVKGNNEILKNLPEQFEAKFLPEAGAGARDDGYFRLKEGYKILFRLNDGTTKEIGYLNIPLEVGTTEAVTTFNHIMHDRGVARWAYGSTKIHIFYNPTIYRMAINDKTVPKNEPIVFYEEKQVGFRGREDSDDLRSLLQWINEHVTLLNLPTNLYFHSYSQMDVGLIDFQSFSLDKMTITNDGTCIIPCLNYLDVMTCHLIIFPRSILTVTLSADYAEGDKTTHQFLAINFYVQEI